MSVFAGPPLAAASGRCRDAQLPSVEMGPPAPVREVERFGQSLPEGPYGRRNRQAIAAREVRVAARLRAVEQAYRMVIERSAVFTRPEPANSLDSPETEADREIELE